MRRVVLITSVLTAVLAAIGGVGAIAAGDGGSANRGVTVLTQTTYPNATPANPQGMPSQAVANEVMNAGSQRVVSGSDAGGIVRTQTTYPDATPADPQGMPSQAAANQASFLAQHVR